MGTSGTLPPHGSVGRMLIADELLLLAIDDTTGKSLAPARTWIDPALGGALLVELALRERISIAPAEAGWRERGRITVINTTPTDDPDLDAVLAKLADEGRAEGEEPDQPDDVEADHQGAARPAAAAAGPAGRADRGAQRGLAAAETPTLDAGPEDEVRARLQSALVDGLTPTERTVALIALLTPPGS